MRSLKEILPNASKSFLEANAQAQKNALRPIVATRRGKMNKTESEFALILEAQQRRGEILRFEYEGITLRWADMRYTPDFVVFTEVQYDHGPGGYRAYDEIKLIEVKGAHVWDRDIVRFKGARAFWPEFAFELHQKTKEGWKQLK